jgi:FkbM family methyltransferase
LVGPTGPVAEAISDTAVGDAARRLGLVDATIGLVNRASGALLPDELVLGMGDTDYRFHLSTHHEYEQFEKYTSAPDGTVLRRFAADLKPDDAVWDVGANVGVFSVVAADRCPSGDVVAFEPYPANAARIRENLTLNDEDGQVVEVALSDEAGETRYRVNTRAGVGAFGMVDDDGLQTVPVETARGDDLVGDDLPAPTVLKIDVQGAELAVLRGLADSLTDCRVVYCNVYEKHFETDRDGETLRELLAGAGLVSERIDEWEGGYFVRATRREGS